jgi:hypothetical protein
MPASWRALVVVRLLQVRLLSDDVSAAKRDFMRSVTHLGEVGEAEGRHLRTKLLIILVDPRQQDIPGGGGGGGGAGYTDYQ